MNYYSPFKVAEMFKQLEAMALGRIDLGMGHATQVLETLALLYDAFPDDHPFAGHQC